MTVRTWINKLFAPKPRTIRKDMFRFQPRLEVLEDRTLLSPVVATNTRDLINDIAAANNGTGPTTIQLQAADATNGFDFASAYNSTLNALPQITANITIEGTSGYTNTVQRSTATGTPAFRLFDVAQGGSLTLENLTLTGGLAQGTGAAGDGGAIYSSGTLNLSNVTVATNKAVGSNGTAGANGGKRTTAFGRTYHVTAGAGDTGANAYGGGLYVAGGTVTLSNDTLSGNNAQGGNGGSGGSSLIFGASGGSGGAGSGGGMYVASGSVTLSNDTLGGNNAHGGNGGNGGSGGFGGFSNGSGGSGGAGSGGGMDVAGGTVTLSNDTISSNNANGGSGDYGYVAGGSGGAGSGGGMDVAGGTVTLSDDTLSGNTANGGSGGFSYLYGGSGGAGSGGGMDVASGTVTLSNDTLSSNQANGGSGGPSDFRSGVSGVSGGGGAGSGGGIYVAGGTVTLSNDTLSSNTAQGGNGGSSNFFSGSGGNGAGGGLDILSSNTTLANTFIAENGVTAGTGGRGTGSPNGSPGNTSGPDVSGNVASSDHDLIGDGSDSNLSSGDSGGDLVGYTADQLYLGSLGDNGGPTKTIALLANSPAIDAGDSNAPGLAATDQRGYARIVGPNVDIGAYEYNATAATTDLSVSGSATSAVYGGQITYTLTVTNNSSSDQSNVTLVDNLPANTTLVSWSVQSGWIRSAPVTGGSSGTVSAWISSLTANTSATFTLVVQLNSSAAAGTVISNTASIGPITGDPTPNGNSVSFQTTINPLAVTLSGSRTYDGTTTAAASILSITNLIGSDNVTLSGSATLAGANAGTQTITSFAGLSLGGTAQNNYTLTGASCSVTINQLAVTLSGSRTYDGTTTAAANILSITNLIGNDRVTLSGSATLAGANAGSEKISSFVGLTLGGTVQNNYTLIGASGSVTINQLAVTLSGSRTYDGTTTAAAGILSITNLVGNDNLTLSGNATLASANAGTQTISSFAGMMLGGAAKNNYTLTGASGSVTITPATVSVTTAKINATAGAPFSGTLATITNNVDPLGKDDYTAVIAWGDGTTSTGTITGSGSTLAITGSHTIADPVNETVQVTISNKQGNTKTATISDTATVTSLGKNVTTGLTGGIGFWNNMNGQALIDSFNGGKNATALATWLATTFPNLYGANAGSNNLTGETNAQVAAYFQSLFKMGGTQVQAQVLAVALNIYATTSSLGGNVGASYGFTVTAWGLGAYSFNVGSDGAAFGVPNNSTRNVLELLLAVNNQAKNGVLYNGNATLQSEAADLFNKLNKAGGIG
jgi:uncharacterized repeat protein (TIGR01451 family)